MDTAKLRQLISQRASLNINDDFALIECWKQETSLLAENIQDSIIFLNTCTDEEFNWVSEVFDDLIDTTQSEELLRAICSRAEIISDPDMRSSIAKDIEFAKDQLRN